MKIIAPRLARRIAKGTSSDRQQLVPRTSYPTISIVRLRRSPLQKLAWIFGFGR